MLFLLFFKRVVQVSAILVAAVGLCACAPRSEQLGLTAAQWNDLTPEAQQHMWSNYRQIQESSEAPPVAKEGPAVHVRFSSGEVVMPPAFHPQHFKPTEVQLAPGQCRAIRLKSVDQDADTVMKGCYDGKKLTFDGSRYEQDKAPGTMVLYQTPLWDGDGVRYVNLHSSGYVHLSHVSIHVQNMA